MNLLVVGHVVHKKKENRFFAYGPYVREMNLWGEYVDQITILAPFNPLEHPDPIDLPFFHSQVSLVQVPQFNLTSGGEIIKTFFKLPFLVIKIWKAMRKADHIHLRCPGNMGLIGSVVQIAFPSKMKSAKYAGNWDRKESKPFSYRIQQKILSNSFLTKNMQVLVYGDWPNESKNIKPFFTASYSETEIQPFKERVLENQSQLRLVFAGGLTVGKQPLISAKVAESMILRGIDVRLDFYGEGEERGRLESFIEEGQLQNSIFLHGNVNAETLKQAFQETHFLIFISQSEGWPKVVAEAMFWGCVPITTEVSCVPQMLGYGERGELVKGQIEEIINILESYILKPELFKEKSQKAMEWSRQFTLERFKKELQSILQVKIKID
ncbi:glycosyl transferase family 1 [Algoriphagus boseongensis]|uniref:Glycosyl transferase family 1 n=1 Tax=Algoriphagus boseongensis TaxID=1442587 RepID=A0A4R6TBM8_9BACT|nr:glycosyltransferase [Algoriphagus boseongensis]TDQ19619.1 glycosyl transferase family 1 [Algoriphagus boseongensis]